MADKENGLAEGLSLIMLISLAVLFPLVLLYGFLRSAARHLVLSLIYLAFVAWLVFVVFPTKTSPNNIFGGISSIVVVILIFEYIIALLYDVLWGWKHPHEIKTNTISGAIYSTYFMYLITFIIFIPMAYGVGLTGNISTAFSIFWYICLLASMFFGFASVLATIETRFEGAIDTGIDKIEKTFK
ncbi:MULTISPECIES: hypothetical protein [Acidiplasma]|uniref:hypothetical protein n=1 Tax=Acidiplasma TaxID=507753 RepID=UPI0005DD1DC4|nr:MULTISPECIES: hypothetical protein [unclassified Acidiplasma]KJE49793.1 hypothetical protein TZ01_01485 [Acidiplasma sp. MBA-1]WMT55511.1 MAG: hypothetical protein RE470_02430 [Acidiplasma sp.]